MRADKKNIVFAFLMLLFCNRIFAEDTLSSDENKERLYSLRFEVAYGASYYSTSANVPLHLETHISKLKQIATARISWKTDHRLSVSLESGYYKIYSFTMKGPNAEGSISITSIPLLLEFSMPVMKNFHLRAGAGSYFQTTDLDYLGKVKSHVVNLGWMAGGSYILYSDKKSAGGVEVKWLDAAEAEHASVALQLFLRYNLVQW